MKKRLFTAALAFVLSIGGFVLSADDDTPSLLFENNAMKLVVATKPVSNLTEGLSLKDSLSTLASNTQTGTFGYKLNGGNFCSLAEAINAVNETVDSTAKTAMISMGKFNDNDFNQYQFGFQKDDDFSPVGPTLTVASQKTLNVVSDPGFFLDSNPESFYQLDFGNDPFNGQIEIMVMGEPLPSSTVTILIALAAAGAFLLYRNRKARERFSTAQA